MLKEWSKELKKEADFEFGGQVFRIRYPYWEDMADILNYTLKPLTNGNGDSEDEGVFEFDYKVDTQYAINRLPLFIDPNYPSTGMHAKLKKIIEHRCTSPSSNAKHTHNIPDEKCLAYCCMVPKCWDFIFAMSKTE